MSARLGTDFAHYTKLLGLGLALKVSEQVKLSLKVVMRHESIIIRGDIGRDAQAIMLIRRHV